MMQQLFFIRKQSYGFTGWCACCDLQGSSAPDGLALCHCCAAGLLMIGHQAAVPPARFKCTTVLWLMFKMVMRWLKFPGSSKQAPRDLLCWHTCTTDWATLHKEPARHFVRESGDYHFNNYNGSKIDLLLRTKNEILSSYNRSTHFNITYDFNQQHHVTKMAASRFFALLIQQHRCVMMVCRAEGQ